MKPRDQFWAYCIYLGTKTRPFNYRFTLWLLVRCSGLVLPTLVIQLDLARSAILSGLQSDLQGTEHTFERLGPSGVSYHSSPPRSISSHKKTLSLNFIPRDDIAQYHPFGSSRTICQLRPRWKDHGSSEMVFVVTLGPTSLLEAMILYWKVKCRKRHVRLDAAMIWPPWWSFNFFSAP